MFYTFILCLCIMPDIGYHMVFSADTNIRTKKQQEIYDFITTHETAKRRPYTVYLHPLLCSGVVITDRFIVSAASCHSPGTPQTTVYLNTQHIFQSKWYVLVDAVYLHPRYKRVSIPGLHYAVHFNIMLLKTKTDLFYIPGLVQAIPIGLKKQIEVDNVGVVTGFSEYETYYEPGRSKELPIQPHGLCAASYISSNNIVRLTDNFCAGYFDSRSDHCWGEYGDGFVVDGKLIGIIAQLSCKTPAHISSVVDPVVGDWICGITSTPS